MGVQILIEKAKHECCDWILNEAETAHIHQSTERHAYRRTHPAAQKNKHEKRTSQKGEKKSAQTKMQSRFSLKSHHITMEVTVLSITFDYWN
jgi:hypothetical protein